MYDALNRKYLMSVILTISLEEALHNHVHEAYTFQIIYAHDKSPSLLITDMNRKTSTNAMPLDAAKRSMQQLFRQLITMTQSLSPLPEDVDKVLAIRLFYNDTAPEDYEPPGFRAATASDSARFVTRFTNDRPHDQEIGSLNTGHHACTLKVTTISDMDDDDTCRGDEGIKFWDAEHNAKQPCQARHPNASHINCPHDDPRSTHVEDEVIASTPLVHIDGKPGSDQESAMETCEPTQVLSQPYTGSEEVGARPVKYDKSAKTRNKSPVSQRVTRAAAAKLEKVTTSNAHLGIDELKNNGKQEKVDLPRKARASNQTDVEYTKPDVITCECGDLADEGVMVQCEDCQGWSHLPCYVSLGRWKSTAPF